MIVHPALVQLAWLRFTGGLRKIKRLLSTPQGIALALVTVGFFGMLLLPQLLAPMHAMPPEMKPFTTWFVHPTALLAFLIFSVAASRMKNPLTFTLPEVEFLFPGPFTRRQLLAYKLMVSCGGTLGVGLMMPLFLMRFSFWGPAVTLGIWWAAIFEQWLALLIVLAIDCLDTRGKRISYAVGGLLLAVLIGSLGQTGAFEVGLELPERINRVLDSPAIYWASLPFVPLNRLIMAQSSAELFTWAPCVLAMIVGTVWLIMRLDADFLEATAVASQRRAEALQRMQRGGGFPTIGLGKLRPSLPQFPRWRGAGAVAWRQSMELVRGSGRLLFVVPILIGPFMALVIGPRSGSGPPPATVIGITVILAFTVSMIMPLGLRTDLDYVDVIKTLPMSALAAVTGSILAALFYLTLLEWIAVATWIVVSGKVNEASVVALALAPALNLLLISADNTLVVLFPSIRHFKPGDFLAGMRMMLVNLAKVAMLTVALLVATPAAVVAWLIWGESLSAIALTGCAMLLIEGIAITWLAAVLFERYDTSAHADDRA